MQEVVWRRGDMYIRSGMQEVVCRKYCVGIGAGSDAEVGVCMYVYRE